MTNALAFKPRNLLFDLDGTLTDPKLGITNCIIYALERMGKEAPPAEELLWCIGPPLHHSFSKLLACEEADQIARAIALYRERFGNIGLFENAVFEGIPELLKSVGEGRRLFVATSKPWVYADRIIERYGMKPYFEKVYGSELSGVRSDKAELIQHLLETEGLAAAETAMIGDREHDVRGALLNGVASIGVTWGYGPVDELRNAGAHHIVDSPRHLLQLLG